MGPTPPGTGVIALATLETSSKSTSPTIPESVLFLKCFSVYIWKIYITNIWVYLYKYLPIHE